MRRHHAVILLASSAAFAAIACAPPAPVGVPTPTRVTAVKEDGEVQRTGASEEYADFTVHATRDAVWRAVVDTYVSMNILPTINDRAGGTFGNQGFVMPRGFNGHLSRDYIDCGVTIKGPRVDTGRLTVTMVSTLLPADSSGVQVRTRVTGIVRNNDGASGEPITCTSTGELENALRAGVMLRLATAAGR